MRTIKPIIPWLGGKRRLIPKIVPLIQENLTEDNTYFEPFVGGGAIFLALEHPKTVIGDNNPDLINLYECVRDDYKQVITYYDRLPNTEKRYYQIREMDRNSNFSRCNRFFKAARFMYLSKTCFGSIMYNKRGEINVAYGKHPERPFYAQEKDMYRMSQLLKNTEIHLADFSETIKEAKSGDVVYLDPPYLTGEIKKFYSYGKDLSLQKLKAHCDELDKKDVRFIVSHSKSEQVKSSFCNYNMLPVNVFRDMDFNNKTKDRNKAEYIITNIDL